MIKIILGIFLFAGIFFCFFIMSSDGSCSEKSFSNDSFVKSEQNSLELLDCNVSGVKKIEDNSNDDYLKIGFLNNGSNQGPNYGYGRREVDHGHQIRREVAGRIPSLGGGFVSSDLLTSRQPTCLESLYFSCCCCFFNK